MQAIEKPSIANGDAFPDVQECWQLITGDKVFRDVQAYLQTAGMMSKGLGYHVIAVFGSQSTGKSTLLNMLFGTTFATMDTANRKQTTKGIWLSKAADANILVLDVEGTDGRERGDDQDFERKSALFSIVTTEVLVVNMWESQVGLYNGANMGLLKTVFEVNLQLFQTHEDKSEKTLLLFVIRDHLGTTPIANLASSVKRDLERIWDSLNKPSNHSESTVAQFFDIEFIGLPHKILQPDMFDQKVFELQQKFMMDGQVGSVFRPQYHKRIPIDGFSIYAKGVWDAVEANKDLDLPTQQQMLAQYRCDELAAEALTVFENSFLPLETDLYAKGTDDLLGARMTAAYKQSMLVFDTDASRYNSLVYAKKRQDLSSLLDNRLSVLYRHQLQGLRRVTIDTFESLVRREITESSHSDFKSMTDSLESSCIKSFTERAVASCVEPLSWSHSSDLEKLHSEISTIRKKLQLEERQRITTEISRALQARLSESVRQEFVQLDASIYNRIITDCFDSLIPTAIRDLKKRLVNLDLEQSQIVTFMAAVSKEGVAALEPAILLETDDKHLLSRLRDHFEEHFKFDSQGIPRVWQSGDNIDGHYKQAKDSALALLSSLSILQFDDIKASSTEDLGLFTAVRKVEFADCRKLMRQVQARSTIQILTSSRQADLASRLTAITSSVYIDAKRSTVSSVANVPLFFYVLLLVLGWNELLALLRNPLYFIALAILGFLAYLIYHLNLTASVEQLTRTMSSTLLDIIKDKLRAALDVQNSNSAVPADPQPTSITITDTKKAQ